MEPAQHQTQQESTLHFLDYWRIIRIRKTVIISVFLLIAITATVVTFILPEKYASTARIQVNPDIAVITTMGGTPSTAGYDAYFIQTEFEIMQSEQVLGRVINNLNLNQEWGTKYNGGAALKTDETMQILKQNMSLSPERNTKLIDITYYSEDKNDTAKLANAIAEAYQDYRLAVANTNASGGIAAMEKQYQDDEQQIKDAQTNVDNLRKELGITDSDPNSLAPSPTLTQEQLQHYHELMMEDYATYIKSKETMDELTNLPPIRLRDELISVNPDSALSDLLSKLRESEQKFVTLTNDYSLENPDVIRVQSLIVELNQQIDARVAGMMAAMTTGVKSQKAVFEALSTEVESAKTSDQQEAEISQPYWEAKRDLDSKVDFHKLLAAKIATEKIDLEIPKTTMVEIIDQAKPAKDPVRPNKTLNITLGIVIGLLVGIGLAFFIEYLDTSVKTIDDVERVFQKPVLGVIPQNVGYLIEEGPESQHAEAYRVLRTNLLFSRTDDKLNSIVVVSAGAGEGKSTTTLNLATVFAQSGQRVIVVDSDLRRPTLHKLLKVTNNLGLTNYLLKQNTLEEVIQTTALAGLDLMASGKLPSSSMNVLGSASMKELILELKRRYDFVFFDSPPIMGVSDASVLASEMDMVIQVIQYRRYPQPMNIRAKQLIEKVGGNLIGIILNNINMSQDESYYYYSGYYHGYYYYSKNEEEQESGSKKTDSGDTERTGIKQKY
jgi:succinoglycan biosynthesis transport protein ExoP